MPGGLNTNFAPETQAGRTLLQAQNVDGYGKFLGLSKVPGSTRVSNDHGSAVKSLHQFEYFDLAGTLTREQLSVAGGALYRINADKSLTSLTTGLVSERMVAISSLDRLHLTSPNQPLTLPAIKYDGANVRRWGVLAPGLTPTVVQALDNHANWTVSTDGTKANSTTSIDGVGSVLVSKTGTTSTELYLERTGLTDDISGAGEDTVYVWLFVPAGALQKLAVSGTAIEIRFGNSGLTNADRHNFSVGDLYPGWNLLSFVTSSPDSQDGAGATLSSIDTWRLRIIFKAAAQTQSGFLWDRLYYNSEGRLTSASGVAGSLAGVYTYRVTYLTEFGVESNAGTPSTSLTLSSLKATGVLTLSANVSNLDTVTIGTKTYTFETTLTDVDGNVKIGASASDSIDNLIAAITRGPGGGTIYAQSTIKHTLVTAAAGAGDTMDCTALTAGTGGNTIATTETSATASWGNATLTGGTDGQKADLTAIPTSPDPQVIARRIYRDNGADAVWRFLTQIDDNSTTTFTDNTTSAALGSTTPPIAGDDLIDNSPPVRFLDAVLWKSRVIAIDADNRFVLHIGDVNGPEQFRIVDQLQVEEELVALESHAYGVIVYATDKVFVLTGDGVSAPIRIDLVNTQLGANSRTCVARLKGTNFVIREREAFLVANPADAWWVSGAIHDQFGALADLADIHVAHDRSRFRIVIFGKSSAGGTYNTTLVYQYATSGVQQISGDGAGVDPQDVRAATWWTLSLPASVNPQCSEMVERTADVPELWVGGNDGYVYYLQDPTATDYATGLTTTPVSAAVEFAAVPLAGTSAGRGEPRFLELSATSTSGATWVATVTLLSGAGGKVIGTPKTFNIVLPAGNSSPIVPVPKLGERAAWVKVKLTNATSGADTVFTTNPRLYYVPRVDFRGSRTS